jgi:hypothetical protein
VLERLTPDIHRWTARHPEWHPAYEWAQEVAAFAVTAGDTLLLVDPLVPDALWPELDALAERADRIAVLITIHYHVRSAADVHRRYRDRAEVSVHAHRSVRRLLEPDVPMAEIVPGEPLPAGAEAFAIGSPRRSETPLLIPGARALCFGDAVVGVDGDLRVWQLAGMSTDEDWYERCFLPTLRPLLDLGFENVLVTHGPPVVGGGREALRRGLDAPSWSLRAA